MSKPNVYSKKKLANVCIHSVGTGEDTLYKETNVVEKNQKLLLDISTVMN